MKTYVVLQRYRVVGGSPPHGPGERVRYGDEQGAALVKRGLIVPEEPEPKKKRASRRKKADG